MREGMHEKKKSAFSAFFLCHWKRRISARNQRHPLRKGTRKSGKTLGNEIFFYEKEQGGEKANLAGKRRNDGVGVGGVNGVIGNGSGGRRRIAESNLSESVSFE